jgi:hypothetical protein
MLWSFIHILAYFGNCDLFDFCSRRCLELLKLQAKPSSLETHEVQIGGLSVFLLGFLLVQELLQMHNPKMSSEEKGGAVS